MRECGAAALRATAAQPGGARVPNAYALAEHIHGLDAGAPCGGGGVTTPAS